MRRIAVAALFLLGANVHAQQEPDWQSVIVRLSVQPDGTVEMIEWTDVEVPPLVTSLERNYWPGDEQTITFSSVMQMISEDKAAVLDFDSPRAGTVRWNVTQGTYRFRIESRLSGAVIPSWSIPRGDRLSADPKFSARRPFDRLRQLLPIWRDASRSRYLLDFQYTLPPRSTIGTRVQFQLYWPKGWAPVHELTGETVARGLNVAEGNPDAYRMLHLFEVDAPAPAAVDLRAHAIRSGSVAAFPIVAFVFWIVFALRELKRYGPAGTELVNEQFVREKVFAHPPEVIAAQWSGYKTSPRLETFLRDLEKQRKVALTIKRETIMVEGEEDEEVNVTVRLLVSREQLTPYERAGIDALIPDGFETSSDQIRRRYEREDDGHFDPTDALTEALSKIAEESVGPVKQAWYSQLLSFVLFWGGVALLAVGVLRADHVPWALFAGAGLAAIITVAWPSTLLRRMIRESRRATLILLLGIPVTFAALVYLNLLSDVPLPPLAAGGAALLMLATYKSILSHATGRESPEAIKRQQDLAKARRWLRTAPNLPEHTDPWLRALGLKTPPREPKGEDEDDWGWALMV